MTSLAQQTPPSIISHSKPSLTSKDLRAVEVVLRSGMIAEGSLVREFETAVSQYYGLTGGIATSSGTQALFLALKALEIGRGDEVILPTYVCRSVWDAVSATNATPVLCDIGDDWCVNAETIKPHITPHTKAIVVAHLFGIFADVTPICALGIPVVEDCCQAVGTKSGNTMAGAFGKLCFLSFHATKLLTTAEGGMVLTDDVELLKQLKGLARGMEGSLATRYRHPLSDFQAALGLSQLARYDEFLRRRRSIADFYFDQFRDLPVQLPHHVRNRSIFFRFPLRIQTEFSDVCALFNKEGIQVRRGVDTLLHRQLGGNAEDFPGAERCFAETLSIPLYPAMTDKECERVVSSCRLILGGMLDGSKAR